MLNIEKLKYPIGKHKFKNNFTNKDILDCIITIKSFPTKVKSEVKNLTKKELNYKYRPKGWSIKQVVSHCTDSHLNSLIRFKLALTENNPVIRPYHEEKWAELTDTLDYSVKSNLKLLKNIHKKLTFLLESLTEKELNRTFIHPDGNKMVSLKENISIYAWHCKHHLAHIKNAIKNKY